MNGLYELAEQTVVMVWFCWIITFTFWGLIYIVKDVIKRIRNRKRKDKKKNTLTDKDNI